MKKTRKSRRPTVPNQASLFVLKFWKGPENKQDLLVPGAEEEVKSKIVVFVLERVVFLLPCKCLSDKSSSSSCASCASCASSSSSSTSCACVLTSLTQHSSRSAPQQFLLAAINTFLKLFFSNTLLTSSSIHQ